MTDCDEGIEIPPAVLTGMENVTPFYGTYRTGNRTGKKLHTFFQELESAMNLYVPNRMKRAANYDYIKAQLLEFRLKGEALNTFRGLAEVDRNSFERAERVLRQIYDDNVPHSVIWERLNKLMQAPNQTVWSLRHEVQYWVEKYLADDPMTARMSEAELKTHAGCLKANMFFSALREDIHAEVAKDWVKIKDFESLVARAGEVERLLRIIRSHKKFQSTQVRSLMHITCGPPPYQARPVPRRPDRRKNIRPNFNKVNIANKHRPHLQYWPARRRDRPQNRQRNPARADRPRDEKQNRSYLRTKSSSRSCSCEKN